MNKFWPARFFLQKLGFKIYQSRIWRGLILVWCVAVKLNEFPLKTYWLSDRCLKACQGLEWKSVMKNTNSCFSLLLTCFQASLGKKILAYTFHKYFGFYQLKVEDFFVWSLKLETSAIIKRLIKTLYVYQRISITDQASSRIGGYSC